MVHQNFNKPFFWWWCCILLFHFLHQYPTKKGAGTAVVLTSRRRSLQGAAKKVWKNLHFGITWSHPQRKWRFKWSTFINSPMESHFRSPSEYEEISIRTQRTNFLINMSRNSRQKIWRLHIEMWRYRNVGGACVCTHIWSDWLYTSCAKFSSWKLVLSLSQQFCTRMLDLISLDFLLLEWNSSDCTLHVQSSACEVGTLVFSAIL